MAGLEENFGLAQPGQDNRVLVARKPDDNDHPSHKSRMGTYQIEMGCIKCQKVSFGTCFQLCDLYANEDGPCHYFATAAHNIFCKREIKAGENCDRYRWVKFVKWTKEDKANEYMLPVGHGIKERNTCGWLKVPDGFRKSKSPGVARFACDYGVIAVRKECLTDKGRTDMKESLDEVLEAESPVDVPSAFLAGYPGEVWTPTKKQPGSAKTKAGYPKSSQGGYLWFVLGGMHWVPPDDNTPQKVPSSKSKPAEQRASAGLFKMEDGRLYRHYIDSSAGQSGSPVYYQKGMKKDARAAGIHVGWLKLKAGKSKNVAVRLTVDHLKEMIEWKDGHQFAKDDEEVPDIVEMDDFEAPRLFGPEAMNSPSRSPSKLGKHLWIAFGVLSLLLAAWLAQGMLAFGPPASDTSSLDNRQTGNEQLTSTIQVQNGDKKLGDFNLRPLAKKMDKILFAEAEDFADWAVQYCEKGKETSNILEIHLNKYKGGQLDKRTEWHDLLCVLHYLSMQRNGPTMQTVYEKLASLCPNKKDQQDLLDIIQSPDVQR